MDEQDRSGKTPTPLDLALDPHLTIQLTEEQTAAALAIQKNFLDRLRRRHEEERELYERLADRHPNDR